MDFAAFELASRAVFDDIPPRYREGVDGLVVRRDAVRHPRFPAVYTLGECVTEAYPSDWSGPDTVRSVVLLHWGSFSALARDEPSFDWQEQIWETLTHELRHHLESLADRDDLQGVDYAMEQSFRRDEGEDFAPDYYRHGDRIGPGVYAVEDDVYIEQSWTAKAFAAAESVRFSWAGRGYAADVPAELGDVHFLVVADDVPPPPFVEVVLVRKPSSWRERLRGMLRRRSVLVMETAVRARPAEGA